MNNILSTFPSYECSHSDNREDCDCESHPEDPLHAGHTAMVPGPVTPSAVPAQQEQGMQHHQAGPTLSQVIGCLNTEH